MLRSGASTLVVDLVAVTFIDSAGLAALVRARRDARQLGGDIVLISPSNRDALRVFGLTRSSMRCSWYGGQSEHRMTQGARYGHVGPVLDPQNYDSVPLGACPHVAWPGVRGCSGRGSSSRCFRCSAAQDSPMVFSDYSMPGRYRSRTLREIAGRPDAFLIRSRRQDRRSSGLGRPRRRCGRCPSCEARQYSIITLGAVRTIEFLARSWADSGSGADGGRR